MRGARLIAGLSADQTVKLLEEGVRRFDNQLDDDILKYCQAKEREEQQERMLGGDLCCLCCVAQSWSMYGLSNVIQYLNV